MTSLSHLLSRRRISVFGHVARLDDDTPANMALHSTDLLTARGVAHLVVNGTSGSTSYETIPPVRLEISGGVLSTVDMVVQRRDGPRRLRDNGDDDDDDESVRVRYRTKSLGHRVNGSSFTSASQGHHFDPV